MSRAQSLASLRLLLAVLLGALGACTQPPVDDPLPDPPVTDKWTLTWSDEFDGPANAAPDASKWSYDIGGGGWGNEQLEFNTNERANSHLDGDGHLVMTALHQAYASNEYTSARLTTSKH